MLFFFLIVFTHHITLCAQDNLCKQDLYWCVQTRKQLVWLCQQDQYHVQDKHVKTRLWENWIMTCAYEMANCVKQDSKNRVEVFMEFLNMTILLTKAIILRDVEINILAPSRKPKADLTSTEITNLSHSAPPWQGLTLILNCLLHIRLERAARWKSGLWNRPGSLYIQKLWWQWNVYREQPNVYG